jgi:hypothetical protein
METQDRLEFIVDGRWMTNDAESAEVHHGCISNVYTTPAKARSTGA